MLRMCTPISGTGKAVVLDIGFCVEKFINKLEAKGVYAGYLIKKQHYWPKGAPGTLLILTFKIRRSVMLEWLRHEPKIIIRSISFV